MGVIGAGPEPVRTCQCTGPECVKKALARIPCANDMDAEDLLCGFCRDHKQIKHCHVFNRECPVRIDTPSVEEEFPTGDDYIDYIMRYVRRRYARFGFGQ